MSVENRFFVDLHDGRRVQMVVHGDLRSLSVHKIQRYLQLYGMPSPQIIYGGRVLDANVKGRDFGLVNDAVLRARPGSSQPPPPPPPPQQQQHHHHQRTTTTTTTTHVAIPPPRRGASSSSRQPRRDHHFFVDAADGHRFQVVVKGNLDELTVSKLRRYLAIYGVHREDHLIYKGQRLTDELKGKHFHLRDGIVLRIQRGPREAPPPPQEPPTQQTTVVQQVDNPKTLLMLAKLSRDNAQLQREVGEMHDELHKLHKSPPKQDQQQQQNTTPPRRASTPPAKVATPPPSTKSVRQTHTTASSPIRQRSPICPPLDFFREEERQATPTPHTTTPKASQPHERPKRSQCVRCSSIPLRGESPDDEDNHGIHHHHAQRLYSPSTAPPPLRTPTPTQTPPPSPPRRAMPHQVSKRSLFGHCASVVLPANDVHHPQHQRSSFASTARVEHRHENEQPIAAATPPPPSPPKTMREPRAVPKRSNMIVRQSIPLVHDADDDVGQPHPHTLASAPTHVADEPVLVSPTSTPSPSPRQKMVPKRSNLLCQPSISLAQDELTSMQPHPHSLTSSPTMIMTPSPTSFQSLRQVAKRAEMMMCRSMPLEPTPSEHAAVLRNNDLRMSGLTYSEPAPQDEDDVYVNEDDVPQRSATPAIKPVLLSNAITGSSYLASPCTTPGLTMETLNAPFAAPKSCVRHKLADAEMSSASKEWKPQRSQRLREDAKDDEVPAPPPPPPVMDGLSFLEKLLELMQQTRDALQRMNHLQQQMHRHPERSPTEEERAEVVEEADALSDEVDDIIQTADELHHFQEPHRNSPDKRQRMLYEKVAKVRDDARKLRDLLDDLMDKYLHQAPRTQPASPQPEVIVLRTSMRVAPLVELPPADAPPLPDISATLILSPINRIRYDADPHALTSCSLDASRTSTLAYSTDVLHDDGPGTPMKGFVGSTNASQSLRGDGITSSSGESSMLVDDALMEDAHHVPTREARISTELLHESQPTLMMRNAHDVMEEEHQPTSMDTVASASISMATIEMPHTRSNSAMKHSGHDVGGIAKTTMEELCSTSLAQIASASLPSLHEDGAISSVADRCARPSIAMPTTSPTPAPPLSTDDATAYTQHEELPSATLASMTIISPRPTTSAHLYEDEDDGDVVSRRRLASVEMMALDVEAHSRSTSAMNEDPKADVDANTSQEFRSCDACLRSRSATTELVQQHLQQDATGEAHRAREDSAIMPSMPSLLSQHQDQHQQDASAPPTTCVQLGSQLLPSTSMATPPLLISHDGTQESMALVQHQRLFSATLTSITSTPSISTSHLQHEPPQTSTIEAIVSCVMEAPSPVVNDDDDDHQRPRDASPFAPSIHSPFEKSDTMRYSAEPLHTTMKELPSCAMVSQTMEMQSGGPINHLLRDGERHRLASQSLLDDGMRTMLLSTSALHQAQSTEVHLQRIASAEMSGAASPELITQNDEPRWTTRHLSSMMLGDDDGTRELPTTGMLHQAELHRRTSANLHASRDETCVLPSHMLHEAATDARADVHHEVLHSMNLTSRDATQEISAAVKGNGQHLVVLSHSMEGLSDSMGLPTQVLRASHPFDAHRDALTSRLLDDETHTMLLRTCTLDSEEEGELRRHRLRSTSLGNVDATMELPTAHAEDRIPMLAHHDELASTSMCSISMTDEIPTQVFYFIPCGDVRKFSLISQSLGLYGGNTMELLTSHPSEEEVGGHAQHTRASSQVLGNTLEHTLGFSTSNHRAMKQNEEEEEEELPSTRRAIVQSPSMDAQDRTMEMPTQQIKLDAAKAAHRAALSSPSLGLVGATMEMPTMHWNPDAAQDAHCIALSSPSLGSLDDSVELPPQFFIMAPRPRIRRLSLPSLSMTANGKTVLMPSKIWSSPAHTAIQHTELPSKVLKEHDDEDEDAMRHTTELPTRVLQSDELGRGATPTALMSMVLGNSRSTTAHITNHHLHSDVPEDAEMDALRSQQLNTASQTLGWSTHDGGKEAMMNADRQSIRTNSLVDDADRSRMLQQHHLHEEEVGEEGRHVLRSKLMDGELNTMELPTAVLCGEGREGAELARAASTSMQSAATTAELAHTFGTDAHGDGMREMLVSQPLPSRRPTELLSTSALRTEHQAMLAHELLDSRALTAQTTPTGTSTSKLHADELTDQHHHVQSSQPLPEKSLTAELHAHLHAEELMDVQRHSQSSQQLREASPTPELHAQLHAEELMDVRHHIQSSQQLPETSLTAELHAHLHAEELMDVQHQLHSSQPLPEASLTTELHAHLHAEELMDVRHETQSSQHLPERAPTTELSNAHLHTDETGDVGTKVCASCAIESRPPTTELSGHDLCADEHGDAYHHHLHSQDLLHRASPAGISTSSILAEPHAEAEHALIASHSFVSAATTMERSTTHLHVDQHAEALHHSLSSHDLSERIHTADIPTNTALLCATHELCPLSSHTMSGRSSTVPPSPVVQHRDGYEEAGCSVAHSCAMHAAQSPALMEDVALHEEEHGEVEHHQHASRELERTNSPAGCSTTQLCEDEHGDVRGDVAHSRLMSGTSTPAPRSTSHLHMDEHGDAHHEVLASQSMATLSSIAPRSTSSLRGDEYGDASMHRVPSTSLPSFPSMKTPQPHNVRAEEHRSPTCRDAPSAPLASRAPSASLLGNNLNTAEHRDVELHLVPSQQLDRPESVVEQHNDVVHQDEHGETHTERRPSCLIPSKPATPPLRNTRLRLDEHASPTRQSLRSVAFATPADSMHLSSSNLNGDEHARIDHGRVRSTSLHGSPSLASLSATQQGDEHAEGHLIPMASCDLPSVTDVRERHANLTRPPQGNAQMESVPTQRLGATPPPPPLLTAPPLTSDTHATPAVLPINSRSLSLGSHTSAPPEARQTFETQAPDDDDDDDNAQSELPSIAKRFQPRIVFSFSDYSRHSPYPAQVSHFPTPEPLEQSRLSTGRAAPSHLRAPSQVLPPRDQRTPFMASELNHNTPEHNLSPKVIFQPMLPSHPPADRKPHQRVAVQHYPSMVAFLSANRKTKATAAVMNLPVPAGPRSSITTK